MKKSRDTAEDWINAIFFPVIGFCVGIVLALVLKIFVEFSAVAGLIVLGILLALVFAIFLWEKFWDGLWNWGFGKVKPQGEAKPLVTKPAPRLLARYGLPLGALVGFLAHFVLPASWIEAIL